MNAGNDTRQDTSRLAVGGSRPFTSEGRIQAAQAAARRWESRDRCPSSCAPVPHSARGLARYTISSAVVRLCLLPPPPAVAAFVAPLPASSSSLLRLPARARQAHICHTLITTQTSSSSTKKATIAVISLDETGDDEEAALDGFNRGKLGMAEEEGREARRWTMRRRRGGRRLV